MLRAGKMIQFYRKMKIKAGQWKFRKSNMIEGKNSNCKAIINLKKKKKIKRNRRKRRLKAVISSS